jgi:hypothetical protein
MNKKELIKSILSDMVYDESIRNGIWKHKSDTYQEFFHHAHGDFMPDDHRYKMIHDVLCNMDDDDDQDPIDMLDSLVPIYSNDLLAWVSSNLTRIGYCNDYQDEFEGSALKLTEIIIGGYFQELQEVYELINEWLSENSEEDDL